MSVVDMDMCEHSEMDKQAVVNGLVAMHDTVQDMYQCLGNTQHSLREDRPKQETRREKGRIQQQSEQIMAHIPKIAHAKTLGSVA